jgi:hypothetical protein
VLAAGTRTVGLNPTVSRRLVFCRYIFCDGPVSI